MKFLNRLKRADFIFVVILAVFVVASILLVSPLMLGSQRESFVSFFLVYNFTILLILIYRENRKNLK
ncbi:MAG: hypothetical protein ABII64_09575 [Elusimicrobiota bacterium]